MIFCSKCGAQIDENVDFCPKCGAPLNEDAKAKAPVNPVTVTSEDKAMSAISYLGILFIIPLIAKKDSEFVRFHVNQGFVLFLAGLISRILSEAFKNVQVIGNIFSIVLDIASLVVFIFSIIGLVKAVKGEKYKLPVVGDITLIK